MIERLPKSLTVLLLYSLGLRLCGKSAVVARVFPGNDTCKVPALDVLGRSSVNRVLANDVQAIIPTSNLSGCGVITHWSVAAVGHGANAPSNARSLELQVFRPDPTASNVFTKAASTMVTASLQLGWQSTISFSQLDLTFSLGNVLGFHIPNTGGHLRVLLTSSLPQHTVLLTRTRSAVVRPTYTYSLFPQMAVGASCAGCLESASQSSSVWTTVYIGSSEAALSSDTLTSSIHLSVPILDQSLITLPVTTAIGIGASVSVVLVVVCLVLAVVAVTAACIAAKTRQPRTANAFRSTSNSTSRPTRAAMDSNGTSNNRTELLRIEVSARTSISESIQLRRLPNAPNKSGTPPGQTSLNTEPMYATFPDVGENNGVYEAMAAVSSKAQLEESNISLRSKQAPQHHVEYGSSESPYFTVTSPVELKNEIDNSLTYI